MIPRFFIDRPIFATALSIAITLTGGIALLYLPVAQYPRITPPGVSITISYPGASAQEVADAVGAPIEQQVNGVDGMMYMSSQSGNDGSYTLTVTFEIGTDVKTALVKVQNRVTLAMPLLPTAVQNQGITIRKRTPDMLMIVSFVDRSPDHRYDDMYLSNFATIFCKDELLRVPGISDVTYYGQRDYSMRVWLDPQKLASRGMTALDVASAIRSQNVDAPAGRIGQPPTVKGQAFQFPLSTLGRLADPEQFGNIVVKIGGRPPILSPSGKVLTPAKGRAPGSGAAPDSLTAAVMAGLAAANSTSDGNDTTTTSDSSDAADSGTSSDSSSAPTSGAASGGQQGGGQQGGGQQGGAMAGGMVGGALPVGGGAGNGLPSLTTGVVRLRDVARIELGAQNYNTVASFDGGPSVGIGLYQLPGTNALEVADRVRKRMEELKVSFPDGVGYEIAYDTSTFVRDSVNDVIQTLFQAVGLVAIVVLVFLQSWRSAVIPLLAVPVAIIGTFTVMAALGYSLNNISLFGLVLAIGIVVDDAIVVVENVERWMERGLEAREATRRAMDETTGPIIAVMLVLCAVFVPCAFIAGITGQFFRQFAVTIAVSTIFSTINSLTFSPALAAILLKPRGRRRDPLTWVLERSLGWFFWLFNKSFNAGIAGYAWSVGKLMRVYVLVLIFYVGLLVLTVWAFRQAPTGFIPQQDQGRLIVNVQMPDAASMERTQEAVALVEKIARGDPNDRENFPGVPGVAHTIATTGMSYLLQANSPNFASMFIVLDPFEKRQAPHLRDTAIMDRLRREWAKNKGLLDARVVVFGSSPVPGLGVAGGFKFLVQDRGGLGVAALSEQLDGRPAKKQPGGRAEPKVEGLMERLKKLPNLRGATTQFRSAIPQYYLDIDRAKAMAIGVSVDEINQTLDMFMGSLYVNSYNDFGRHWQVTIQADGKFRTRIEYINLFQLRNKSGSMVPLGALVVPREIGGPISVTRYNLYTSAAVNGNVKTGESTGEVIKAIDKLADETLPRSMGIEWTELMYLQIKAGNTAIWVFILSVISVFLALSALYESWALPLAVILVVPLCLLCSVAGVLFTHRDVNIFVQIGLVVLVGLACKNAILIVEFARHLHLEGCSCFEATKEASRLRLRPILMTSFAFIFGVLPLMYASGAGAEMRRSLGTAVFSGMLGVTLFGIFLTPVFFFVIQGLDEMRLRLSSTARATISYTIGAAIGGVSGFALAQVGVGNVLLGIAPSWWMSFVGACLAILLIRAVREIYQRIKPGS